MKDWNKPKGPEDEVIATYAYDKTSVSAVASNDRVIKPDNLIERLKDLISAAKPFTRNDIVTETSGTIPLMEKLEDSIGQAEEILKAL